MRSIRKADTFRDNFRASFPTSFFPGKSRILISSPLSGIGPVTTNLGDKIFFLKLALRNWGSVADPNFGVSFDLFDRVS